jgi:hypothetical protein
LTSFLLLGIIAPRVTAGSNFGWWLFCCPHPLLAFHHHTSEVDAFDFGDSAKAFALGVPAESPERKSDASFPADLAIGCVAACAFACDLAPGWRPAAGGIRGTCARLVVTARG